MCSKTDRSGCQKVSEKDQEQHNHKLQTNPRHREEEPQNTHSNNTSVRQ